MQTGDELDLSLTSIQRALNRAVNLTQSHSTLDDNCKQAIIEYLYYAIDNVTDAQNKKLECDQEYMEQVLRDVHHI